MRHLISYRFKYLKICFASEAYIKTADDDLRQQYPTRSHPIW